MEIFIGYTRNSNVTWLRETLEAWDELADTDPVAIECPPKKYELFRRVAAENTAVGDYILCELGWLPTYDSFVAYAQRMLLEYPKVGIFHMRGVAICRRGIVDKWPTPKSEFYAIEHVRAYELQGYGEHLCKEAYCRQIGAC